MKKYFLFFILTFLFFSCKKNCSSPPEPVHGTKQLTGTLLYSDPASDGPGLYYNTDDKESLIFKNEFSDMYTQYLHFKNFVNVHSRLTYSDTGDSACLSSMMPGPCSNPLRVVQVISLVKE